jgi:hypothetical protein
MVLFGAMLHDTNVSDAKGEKKGGGRKEEVRRERERDYEAHAHVIMAAEKFQFI